MTICTHFLEWFLVWLELTHLFSYLAWLCGISLCNHLVFSKGYFQSTSGSGCGDCFVLHQWLACSYWLHFPPLLPPLSPGSLGFRGDHLQNMLSMPLISINSFRKWSQGLGKGGVGILVRCLHTNESHRRFSQNGVHIWQSQLRLTQRVFGSNMSCQQISHELSGSW